MYYAINDVYVGIGINILNAIRNCTIFGKMTVIDSFLGSMIHLVMDSWIDLQYQA